MAEEREPEEGEPEEPQAVKPKVKAVLKPKRDEDEVSDGISALKERVERLEGQRTPSWREVGQKESKPVGTNFDSELLDRMNKTVEDYGRSGIKLYKRKLLESGLSATLDDLNSVWQLDDCYKKSRGNVEKFLQALQETSEETGETETDKVFIWTKERAAHVIYLWRGRPDQIEALLKAAPEIRGLIDFAAIEKAKKASKPKIKGEGGDFMSAMLGEDEGEGEGEEGSSESESEGEDKGDLLDEMFGDKEGEE